MTGFARQLASRTVPGYVNVLGEATNTASVSVNTTMAYRKDRYFRAELSVSNSANPVWLGITNLAVMPVGSGNYVVSNVTGHVLWPKTPETFTYDADGNLTSDSLWTNQWNAENRRTVIESRSDAPSLSKRKVQWTHLPDGRWIERIVSTNNGTAYYPAFTNRYVWDGNVLLAVLDHANNLVVSFMRGLDLSGTPQGAGGVGGLLAVSFANGGTHFAAYDGNGNVAALVSATDGTETARYEYGPFGEPLRMTGPMAKLNPIRFSTQYADDVTGDVKYLYRDYDSTSGRWPSRDPIEEYGGLNLYGFVGNNPINRHDILGLAGPLAGFAINCIREIAMDRALGWLKDASDKNLACSAVKEAILDRPFGIHIGCKGEAIFDASPYMHHNDNNFLKDVANCLWGKIKDKGIGKILKDLPDGVEKSLLEEALGGGIESLEDATNFTGAKHQIRAKCTDKGIEVSVFTQVSLTFAGKDYHLSDKDKNLGLCPGGKGTLYDMACGCCPKSPHQPK